MLIQGKSSYRVIMTRMTDSRSTITGVIADSRTEIMTVGRRRESRRTAGAFWINEVPAAKSDGFLYWFPVP
jgi:hypothetical protein